MTCGRMPRWAAIRRRRGTLSPRAYPAELPPLEYPGHFLVKRVTHAGTIRFQDRLLFLANALKEHHVGLEESDDGVWSLYLGSMLLGTIDEATRRGVRLNPHPYEKCHLSSRNSLLPILPLAHPG